MNRKPKGRRAPRGMTLIEIMVVLVILGLIASAVVIAVFPQLQKARVDRTTLDIGNSTAALKLYNATEGQVSGHRHRLQGAGGHGDSSTRCRRTPGATTTSTPWRTGAR